MTVSPGCGEGAESAAKQPTSQVFGIRLLTGARQAVRMLIQVKMTIVTSVTRAKKNPPKSYFQIRNNLVAA